MHAIIVHGAYGHPEENWFPWLKEELKKIGYRVFVPKFPTPKGQTLENWLKVFEKYEKYLDENSILIGHSLGCAFILAILERLKKPIRAAFLVAGFLGRLGIEKFDKINKSFTKRSFNWNKIRKNCKRIFVYSSDNDPYVPLKKGKELAEKLEIELIVVKSAGHFNEEAGYKKFERLLEDIKKL